MLRIKRVAPGICFALVFCLLLAVGSVAEAAKRVVQVAHNASFPPMEFMDANGRILGYSVDYVDAIGREVGFIAEHKHVEWDDVFDVLANNSIDLVASSMSVTPERKSIVDFSEPYYEVRQVLVTAPLPNLLSLADMKGKRVGAKIGTTGYEALRREKNLRALGFESILGAMAALTSGRIDGVICDEPVAAKYIVTNNRAPLTISLVLDSGTPEYYAFAVRKGNRELLERINKGIAAIKAKGIDRALSEKWLER